MKTVILVRHAKSSWDDHTLTDFDRPLNDRGKKDAPEMGERLVKRKIKIDLFVSSSAKRAKKTAQAFAEAFGLKKDEVVLNEALYLASPEVFYNVITELPESVKSVVVFSHNPGLTDFVNSLSDTRVDNVPTCGMYAVTFKGNWQHFREATKEFLFFDYPKNIFD
ncbi:MAG TPA: histidine phosphatase family protein [Chitinophagaceae bacterium]